jgi:hypothetical protein
MNAPSQSFPMTLDRCFHLLEYLTLGLSCVALVFAEAPFLPDLQICLAPVLMLLLLAWWMQGRWSLPNWGANILGLVIAAGGVFWLVRQLTDETFALAQLPLHLALLPYMGPLLMAALLVKIFQSGDAAAFWHTQGLGLMQIGLGCVLDADLPFGVTMTAYLASAVACLSLRYRLSARRAASGQWRVADEESSVLAARHSPLATIWLLSFTLRWTLLVAGPSLLLFLLTPRRDNWAWQPLNNFRSGYSHSRGLEEGEEINLNSIGRIFWNDEVALQVTAVNADGKPKLDLSAYQHWRGVVLDWYDKGKWVMFEMPALSMHSSQRELPRFADEHFFLTFTVQPRQAGGLVLAEPIRFGPARARLPVASVAEEDQAAESGQGLARRSGGIDHTALFTEVSGTVMPQMLSNPRREYRYRQIVPASGDPSRTAAERMRGGNDYKRLVTVPAYLVTDIRYWTIDLLRRLSPHARYRLSEVARADLMGPRDSFQLYPEDWEATARILTEHLASSGEFTYSMEISRQDRSIDPVLDFLVNVKQGHCELYAAALALMLRSIGIPARLVKGFRGCDNQGDGQYLIRHHHAHTWVEILVPHDEEGSGRAEKRDQMKPSPVFKLDWLTLDPTPAESAAAPRSFSLPHLWEEAQRICLQSWRSLIVDFNGEDQAGLWHMLKSSRLTPVLLKLTVAALASMVAFAAWLLLRRLRLRGRTAGIGGDAAAAVYLRFVRILERYTFLRPNFAQTPREHGEAAQAFLQGQPVLAALAILPNRIVDLFYRARFGGLPLTEVETRTLDAELDRFAETLRLFSRQPKTSG